MTDREAAAITARDRAIDEGAAAPFDAVALARRLLRTTRAGALATLDPSGHPFASLVNVASDADGAPLVLVSQLALHSRNIARDPRVSLLLAASGKGDPLAHPRLSVSGAAGPAPEAHQRQRFLAHHPKAAVYAGFADFSVVRIEPAALALNGGPARAAEPAVGAVLLNPALAAATGAGEAGALAHMNEDHGEAVRLYATRLAGLDDGPWRLAGIDAEGIDLALGDRLERFVFPEPLGGADAIGPMLKRLAAEARSRPPRR